MDSPYETPSVCNVCGNQATSLCSRCKSAHYCSVEHQKADWKQHKKVCFAPGSICTRCHQATSNGAACQIPHPAHLRESMGSQMGPGGTKHHFRCVACNQDYTYSGSSWDTPMSDMTITSGPVWCFHGPHTVKPVTDNRKIFQNLVVISPPDIQSQINRLDANQVRVLKIHGDGSFYDQEALELTRNLPQLEELQIEDVDFTRITLKRQTAPELTKISFQNVSEECQLDIQLPKLKHFSIYYHGPGNTQWIERMLEQAHELEEFDSYKLRTPFLGFYSNQLRRIRLHRAELLEELELWAPRLVDLNLQACYDLDTIRFLQSHALQAQLPSNFSFNDELEVNSMNACLGNQAIRALNDHPRVRQIIEDDSMDEW